MFCIALLKVSILLNLSHVFYCLIKSKHSFEPFACFGLCCANRKSDDGGLDICCQHRHYHCTLLQERLGGQHMVWAENLVPGESDA